MMSASALAEQPHGPCRDPSAFLFVAVHVHNVRGYDCATRAVALDGAEQKGTPAGSSLQLQRGAARMLS